MLNENFAQILKELAKKLNVIQATASKHLHDMGKIHKEGKWVSHELTETNTENRLMI